jgi:hypothetical protein
MKINENLSALHMKASDSFKIQIVIKHYKYFIELGNDA